MYIDDKPKNKIAPSSSLGGLPPAQNKEVIKNVEILAEETQIVRDLLGLLIEKVKPILPRSYDGSVGEFPDKTAVSPLGERLVSIEFRLKESSAILRGLIENLEV